MSQRAADIAISIDEALDRLSYTSSYHCIFRVYYTLRIQNETAYEPLIVAIGPYYHGEAKFQEMEDYKMLNLQQLLQRRKESVYKYIEALIALEERARKCYAESIYLGSDEFIEMTLLDGFFIIELFRKWWRDRYSRDTNDPIQQHFRIAIQIRRDLMLLENQLPYFILLELFNMTKDPEEEEDITELAYYFLGNVLPGSSSGEDLDKVHVNEIKHLLHLVHEGTCISFARIVSTDDKNRYRDCDWRSINSVTEIQEAGVEFKKSEENNSLFDIKFTNGVIEIPELTIDEQTESCLRNLIAYEQFLPNHHPRYVTDYTYFLCCLVKSPKDAICLRSCGILNNYLNDSEVCVMLNKLGNCIFFSDFFSYAGYFNDVNQYCKGHWKKWMANLRLNHFSTPWTIMSLSAAVLLLLLTLAQTLFSVLSYSQGVKS